MDFKCEVISVEKINLENGDKVFRVVFLILGEKLNENTTVALIMEKPVEVGKEINIIINL